MKVAMRFLAIAAITALIPLGGVAIAVNGNETLDHYKCYDVSDDTIIGATVSLADQFQERSQEVKKPRFLCNPVDKNGEGIVNSTDHLVCYAIFPNQNVGEEVSVSNQFGSHGLKVKKDQMLCVPSSKSGDQT